MTDDKRDCWNVAVKAAHEYTDRLGGHSPNDITWVMQGQNVDLVMDAAAEWHRYILEWLTPNVVLAVEKTWRDAEERE